MFKLSKGYNENYIGQIVKLDAPTKHENADKLQIFTINNQQVITNLDYKQGDLVAFFTVGSQLNKDFVKYFNGYSNPLLNADGVTKSYFDNHARIKAIRLRGSAVEGFILPIQVLLDFLGSNIKVIPGIQFDSYNNILLVQKYIIQSRNTGANLGKVNSEVSKGLRDRMIENQFKFHIKTNNLKNYTSTILDLNSRRGGEDIGMSITYKVHGTSAIFSNVLIQRNLNWFERLLLKLGVNIPTSEYEQLYASRQVIKGSIKDENTKEGYYTTNVWKEVFEELIKENNIPKGYTIYSEIVGFTSNNGFIQKGYDYGCDPNQKKMFVYRITNTNPDGKCIELSWSQIKDFCKDYNLLYVPELYNGKLSEFFKNHKIKNDKMLIDTLSSIYNIEGDCTMCNNKVPTEGIVLRVENLNQFVVFKLKSHNFVMAESNLEVATMEDEN